MIGAKKLLGVVLLSAALVGAALAATVNISNLTLGTLTNLSGLATNVIDISNASIQTVVGADRVNVAYRTCMGMLYITSLTGTSPTANVFIDETYDGGTNYHAVVSFTQCTAACAEARAFVLPGLTGSLVGPQTFWRPGNFRVRRTTGGTGVTDLDYSVRVACLNE